MYLVQIERIKILLNKEKLKLMTFCVIASTTLVLSNSNKIPEFTVSKIQKVSHDKKLSGECHFLNVGRNATVYENIHDDEINTSSVQVQYEEFRQGWVKQKCDVKRLPNDDSEVLGSFDIGDEVIYRHDYYFKDWCEVKFDNCTKYVKAELISDVLIEKPKPKPKSTEHNVPANRIMSYMSYRCITSKGSKQYKLQQIAYTGNFGIRQVNGRYCIAVGSAYSTEIGTYIDIVLHNGAIIPCILADCKANQHTDSNNKITSHDGSAVEFVVDTRALQKDAKRMGNISYATKDWRSTVANIIVYEKKEVF